MPVMCILRNLFAAWQLPQPCQTDPPFDPLWKNSIDERLDICDMAYQNEIHLSHE